ncbi:MAG: efflux RND transporter periplasmic adaptor subunit [Rhodobiaceae bacterium]|nr:efflux RND transporter periplasmic adaptor subunit [Rhodobiaceae bacterium]
MTNSLGRMVYLGLVAALAVGLVNFLFGDFVFLRADGLVVRDRASVAATYLAYVDSVAVKPGQTVKKGDELMRLRSTDMLERLADLSSNRAQIAARVVDFKVRLATASRLMPLAERREQETTRVLKDFDGLSNRNLVTSVRYDEALLSRFDAQQEFVRLATENEALSDELKALEAAQADADNALVDLRAHYNDGVIAAPADGSVGADIPAPGDVHRPGEMILSIYSGAPYVLAYLPRRYLFAIRPGMRVKVSNGRMSATGEIETILPLTKEAPREFQNAFRPADRNQLGRIRLDNAPDFPLHEKVRITGPWLPV